MIKGNDNKEYIGDGVCIEHDGQCFILTTENGIEITNKIYLEPFIIPDLIKYIRRIYNIGDIE